jgi:hypothetical protein
VRTRPTFIVDGLGKLNPALAITQYPDLREWLAGYKPIFETSSSAVYATVAETKSNVRLAPIR